MKNAVERALNLFSSCPSITSNTFKRGKTKLPKALYNKLVVYVACVVQGFRDAYLVDGAQSILDRDSMRSVLQHIMIGLAEDGSDNVALIQLGLDMILIRTRVLLNKIEALQKTPSHWEKHALLVNIDLRENTDPSIHLPSILSENEVNLIASTLLASFEPLVSLMPSIPAPSSTNSRIDCYELQQEIELLEAIAGYPFVVGWLLGYPCIYRSTRAENLLSMLPLQKVSIIGAVPSGGGHVDLAEFTVPKHFLAQGSDACELFNSAIHQRMLDLQQLIAEKKSSSVVTTVEVGYQEYTLPSVML